MAEKQIFTNGKIFTAADAEPYVDSMIVEEGKIIWTGRREELPESGGDAVDLQGKCVIPGFVDAHMHPVMLADFRKKIAVMPPDICSIRDLTEAIRLRREQQGPGKWIQGWGYDEQALAEKLSVSRQTVISLENGRYNPSIRLAYDIAKIFDCIIEEVFLFEEEDVK